MLQPVSITAPLMWYSISGFDAVPLDRVDWGHSSNDQSTLEHTYTHPCHMPNSDPRGQQHLIICFTSCRVKLRHVHEKSSVAVRQAHTPDHMHTSRSVCRAELNILLFGLNGHTISHRWWSPDIFSVCDTHSQSRAPEVQGSVSGYKSKPDYSHHNHILTNIPYYL